MIQIQASGSFGYNSATFGAQEHGHAQAVADAIKFLAEKVLPAAIINDHKCHTDGIAPSVAFGKAPAP